MYTLSTIDRIRKNQSISICCFWFCRGYRPFRRQKGLCDIINMDNKLRKEIKKILDVNGCQINKSLFIHFCLLSFSYGHAKKTLPSKKMDDCSNFLMSSIFNFIELSEGGEVFCFVVVVFWFLVFFFKLELFHNRFSSSAIHVSSVE